MHPAVILLLPLLGMLATGAAATQPPGQASPAPVAIAGATPGPAGAPDRSPEASAPSAPAAAAPLPAVPAPISQAPAATLPSLHRLVRDLKSTAENIKSTGNFGAQLWLIADNRFFQEWRRSETPALDPVDTAIRGQPIFTVIVFYGASRDEKVATGVVYDLTVRRPDGSIYSAQTDLVGCEGTPAADERMLMLGRSFLNITIGPDDPAGKYTVEALVKSSAGKASVTLKSGFTVP